MKPILSIIVFSFLSGLVFGQDKGPLCSTCKTTGMLPNPFYEKAEPLEAPFIYCSWQMEEDPLALGLTWIPCAKCKNPDLKAKARAEFNAAVKIRRDWLNNRRLIDESLKIKKPLLHLTTTHFDWAWNIPKVKVGRKTLKSREALMLYGQRMETFYEEFHEIYQLKEEELVNLRHGMYVFERVKTGRVATGLYTGSTSNNGCSIKVGKPSGYVVTWNKSKFATDGEFHNNLIHVGCHLFTGSFRNYYWCYSTGVFYEGLAHWWEDRYYKMCTTHCAREQSGVSNWVPKGWRGKVRKLVNSKKQPALADIMFRDTGSLSAVEHQLGWSYMDFMMFLDPRKTIEFIGLLKEKKPPSTAFRTVWGFSTLSFEEKWIDYVKSKYKASDPAVVPKRSRKK